jgi:hypothetical protein
MIENKDRALKVAELLFTQRTIKAVIEKPKE